MAPGKKTWPVDKKILFAKFQRFGPNIDRQKGMKIAAGRVVPADFSQPTGHLMVRKNLWGKATRVLPIVEAKFEKSKKTAENMARPGGLEPPTS